MNVLTKTTEVDDVRLSTSCFRTASVLSREVKTQLYRMKYISKSLFACFIFPRDLQPEMGCSVLKYEEMCSKGINNKYVRQLYTPK